MLSRIASLSRAKKSPEFRKSPLVRSPNEAHRARFLRHRGQGDPRREEGVHFVPVLPILAILMPPDVGHIATGRRLDQELSPEHLHHARSHRGGRELADLPTRNEPVDIPVGNVRVVDLAELSCPAPSNRSGRYVGSVAARPNCRGCIEGGIDEVGRNNLPVDHGNAIAMVTLICVRPHHVLRIEPVCPRGKPAPASPCLSAAGDGPALGPTRLTGRVLPGARVPTGSPDRPA